MNYKTHENFFLGKNLSGETAPLTGYFAAD
jgi:hypothetical protein